ncbi:MAG: CMP deaminase [Proteobacteria bacterium]|nr:CMP deaminase [Pseudomonadota bacterium]
MDWDTYFAGMLTHVAVKSKDPSTKVGAIVVGPDKEIRSTGYNSFPRGLNDNVPERFERPEKYFWFEHAERNAIYNAARHGSSMKDCTLYVSMTPCLDCARGVVQAGIKEVVVCEQNISNQQKWDEHNKRVGNLFEECGVKIRYFQIVDAKKAG